MEYVNLKEIVIRLKAVKDKERITISEIMAKLEIAGYHLAESTVRRVFRDNSENELGFTYAKVLKPIADVLLSEELEMADDPALYEKNEALHSIIKEKNREIDVLVEKLEAETRKTDAIKSQLDDLRKTYDDRINALWEQIHIKDRRMDEKDALIKRLMEKYL